MKTPFYWSMDVVMPLQLFCQGLQQESYIDELMIYYSLNKSFCQHDKLFCNKKCNLLQTNGVLYPPKQNHELPNLEAKVMAKRTI